MKQILIFGKMKSIFIILLLLGLPSFLLITSVSSKIPNYDVNSDGSCNILDVVKVASHMREKGTPGWIREDVDKNGIIQLLDMILVTKHHGESGWNNEMAKLKKLSIAYGNTMRNTTNQAFIASHFDMVDCTRTYPNAAANVKILNPNITNICYFDSTFEVDTYSDWNYVTQFEDWFVHDKNGNRITSADYPHSYLMNPNSGWSDYLAQKCHDLLQNYPQYDGIFADDAPLDLVEAGYLFSVPFTDFEEGVLSTWDTWMLQHIQNLQTTIETKILMPNSWKYTQFCENITHVHFWEGFVHGRSHNIDQTGYGVSYTLYAIDTLHEQAEMGNILAVVSGTKNADSNPALAHKYMLFTMICFLFAVEDMQKSYYAYNFFGDDTSHGWYPEMDYEFGNPIGDYYNVKELVYARQFENATVFANISPSATTTFVFESSSYEIGPRTGLIIP